MDNLATQKNHRILEKSLHILEYASKNPNGTTLAEFCTIVEMPKSSVHLLLHTFTNLGYLRREDDSNKYTLGIRAFEVGSGYNENNELLRQGRQVVDQISLEFNETVHLGVLDGSEVVYLHKHESTQTIRMISDIGHRNPAHATAIGKALLSGLSDEELLRLYHSRPLVALTPNTIVSLAQLLEQTHEIQQTGIAYEKEESSPNIQCLAVPIKRRDKSVAAAISISMLTFRKQNDLQKFRDALLRGKSLLESGQL